MDCERVREEFVERLTGTLDPERSKAVDEHIAGCAACRAETDRMRDIWSELGALRPPIASGAGARVARLVEARGASNATSAEPSRPARRPARALVAAAALAASLVIGFFVGRTDFKGDDAVLLPKASAPVGREQYILLLHGPARTTPSSAAQAASDSVAEQNIVAEYRAWANGLRDSGALVIAEKLADEPLTMLTANGAASMPRNTPDELGGFFLIQVADSAEAFRIARACPHLKYGGTVQVRRIQPT